MRKTLMIGGALVAFLIAGVTIAGVLRTRSVESDPRQKTFVAARVPDTRIDGPYRGSLQGREVSWKGKKFKAAESGGINLFQTDAGRIEERYPFRTYVGQGLKDGKTSVLKIDYGLGTNPWWLRRILDEVVEVAPGQLLGKVHVKWIFGMTFTVGYFRLDRTSESTAPAATTPAPLRRGTGATHL